MNKVHSTFRPFACDICQSKFRTSSGLRQHIDYVHLKIYCPKNECPYISANEGDSNAFRRYISDRNRLLECDDCEFRTNKRYVMYNHKKVDHFKPYLCNRCDFQTGEKTELYLHMGGNNMI